MSFVTLLLRILRGAYSSVLFLAKNASFAILGWLVIWTYLAYSMYNRLGIAGAVQMVTTGPLNLLSPIGLMFPVVLIVILTASMIIPWILKSVVRGAAKLFKLVQREMLNAGKGVTKALKKVRTSLGDDGSGQYLGSVDPTDLMNSLGDLVGELEKEGY